MTDDVNLQVYVRRNADGVVRSYEYAIGRKYVADGTFDYCWGEGNFSCNCNRAMFFAQAEGEEDPDEPCGEGKYSVSICDDKGERVYQDGAWGEAR